MPDPGAKSGAVSFVTQSTGLDNYVVFKPEAGQLRLDQAFDDGVVIKYMVTNGADISIERGTVTLPDTLTRDVFVISNTGAPISWPTTGQRTVSPISEIIPLCDTPPTDGQVLIWDAAANDGAGAWCPGDIPPSTSTPTNCGVDMQNVDSGTTYTVTIAKCETQVIWNSADPGEKDTTIAAVGADQDGYVLHIKANTGDDSVHCVIPTGATIGGLSSDKFNDNLCDLSLVYNHAKTDWMIRCLCCYTPTECEIVGDAVYFDAQRAAVYGTSGLIDTPKLSFSFWVDIHRQNENSIGHFLVNMDPTNLNENGVLVGHGNFSLYLSLSNRAIDKFILLTASGPAVGTGFLNILGSVDTSQPGPPIVRFYSGDEDISIGGGSSLLTDDGPWDMALADGLYITSGAELTGTNFSNDSLRCNMGDFWLLQGEFIDFDIAANRGKFHDLITGAPISLGSSGQLPTGSPPTVYLHGGETEFGTNLGTAGAFTSVGLEDSLVGLHVTLPAPANTRGGISIPGGIAEINGDQLFAPSDYPTTNLGSTSFWLRLDALPGSLVQIVTSYTSFANLFGVLLNATGHFVVHFGTTNNLNTLTFTQTSAALAADGNYHHIALSWDTQTASLALFIDRVPASFSVTGAGGFNVDFGDLVFSHGWKWFLGYTGDAAEFWLLLGTQLDFSNSTVLDKFELSGASVDLGLDGALPTGSPPTWYLSQSPQTYTAVTFWRDRAHDQKELYGATTAPDITVAPAPYP